MKKDKENSGFLIGEMSIIFKISIDTLRYYDKIGLLKPEYIDQSGYRRYGIKEISKIRYILFLREMKVSIKQITKLINNSTVEDTLYVMEKSSKNLGNEIKHLKLVKKLLDNRITYIKNVKQYILQYDIQEIPERYYLIIKEKINYNSSEEAFPQIKQSLLDFTERNENNMMQFYPLGEITEKHNSSERAFVCFPPSKISENCFIIPKSIFVCIKFKDSVFFESNYTLTDLIKWGREKGYKPDGKLVNIWHIEDNITRSMKDFTSEIQIPVKKI